MKVQTLALLGHFRTMNPPGPFSPLWRKAKRVRQSQAGILAGNSLWLWDAPHRAEPGSEEQSPGRQEQMLGAREGVCLGSRCTSQHGRAAFPQVPWQCRCQGCRWSSSSASGSCQLLPTGSFPRHSPGCKQEVSGSSVCSGQAQHLSLQPPDPSQHHLIRL